MNNLIIKIILVISFGLFLAPSVFAAETYVVRSSADCAINGDGTSWACASTIGGTGAMSDIPTNVSHGAVYYIAAGTYGPTSIGLESYTGTEWAYVKKATTTEHGSSDGWSNSYALGQAVFTALTISGSYITLDGVTGSGTTGYGIKVERPYNSLLVDGDVASLTIIKPHEPYGVNHVVINHVEISMSSNGCVDIETAGAAGYTPRTYTLNATTLPAKGEFSNITISNCYIHGGSSNIHIGSWKNSTIRDNYFGNNCSQTWSHGQQISPVYTSNISVFNNEFHNSEVFVIGAHQGTFPATVASGNSYWKVYNNIIVGGTLTAGFAMAESGESDGLTSSHFHNNTFANVALGKGAVFVGTQTDVPKTKSYAYNNLFYNCTNPRMDNTDKTAGAIEHNNSAYIKCTGAIDYTNETSSHIGNTDPFVNSASGNFRLATGVILNSKGLNLYNYFTIDKDNKNRGNSKWSIGAYRASGPAPPQNVSITINQ